MSGEPVTSTVDAPVTLSVEVDMEPFAAALSDLGPRARTVIRKALKAGADPVATAARMLIHSRTGLLASGLRSRSAKNDRPGRLAVLVQSVTTRAKFADFKGRRRRKVSKGNPKGRYRVYYGAMVEKGHRIVRGGKTVGRVPPHPFMGPAFDANQEAAAQRVENELDRLIRMAGQA